MEYTNVSGDTPRISILGLWRFAPRPLEAVNINLCYYRTWDFCVGKEHFAPPNE